MSSKALRKLILAELRATRVKRTVWQIACEFEMTGPADLPRFLDALDTIPASRVLRVRGQGGYLLAL